MFTDGRTGELLAAASHGQVAPDSVESDMIRVARRDYERLGRVPSSLVAEMRRHASLSYAVWVQARAENDFAAFAPFMQRSFQLARELADHGISTHLAANPPTTTPVQPVVPPNGL